MIDGRYSLRIYGTTEAPVDTTEQQKYKVKKEPPWIESSEHILMFTFDNDDGERCDDGW